MKDITELIALDWRNGALFVAGIIIIFVFMIQKWDWIIQRFGIISKKALAEEKRDKEIGELKEHAKKTDQNFDKIFESVDRLQCSIDDLSQKLENMKKRIDENEAAKLGDRISQAYHFYKKRGTITPMEKWAFDNMVKQYQASGGDSWVDEVAVPQSHNWEVIDE